MQSLLVKKSLAARVTAVFSSVLVAFQPLMVLAQDTGFADPEAEARVAIQLSRSVQAIEDGLTLMDRSRWDPQYVADQLGPNPSAILAWMRQNVAFVPYAGALRGAEGVLSDHYANALDGAILTASLLKAAGYDVRIASATLDDAAIDAILTAAAPAASAEAPVAAESFAEAAPAMAEAETLYEMEPGAAELAIAGPAARAELTRNRIREEIYVPGLGLYEALPKANGAAAPAEFDPTAQTRAALADHFWVEYRDGANWTSADWLTPDGVSPAAPATTFAVDDVPVELLQSVVIRVIVEQVKDGAASEVPILATEIFPARGQGRHVTLVHQPMAWPADWPTTTKDDVQVKLRAAFATQREWWPVMALDDEAITGPSVRADGSLNDSPQPQSNPFGDIGIKLAGQLVEATDQFRTGEDVPEELASGVEPETTGQWTAEWIEVTTRLPNGASHVERRPVFDLIGPAKRAAGEAGGYVINDQDRATRSMRAMSEIEIGVLPALPSSEKILFDGAMAVLENRGVLSEISADPFGKVPSNSVELMSKMQPIPGAIESFASLRMVANPVGYAVYQDRPLIVARHNYYARDLDTGDFRTLSAMDIIDASVGVNPWAGVDPVYARLMQGLADAEAETEALQGTDLPFGAGPLLTSGPLSDWVLVGPADDPGALPDDLLASVKMAQADGLAALVPAGAMANSGLWWKIDPATGQTIAMGPDGWGQALVEYAFILVMKTLWAQIGCMARTATKGALEQAIDKGKVNLPKTMEEAKKGTKDLAKACIRDALINSITGMTTTVFVGLPGYVDYQVKNGIYGPNYGSRVPPTMLPPPPAPLVDKSKGSCPPGLPGSCAINTPRSSGGGNPGGGISGNGGSTGGGTSGGTGGNGGGTGGGGTGGGKGGTGGTGGGKGGSPSGAGVDGNAKTEPGVNPYAKTEPGNSPAAPQSSAKPPPPPPGGIPKTPDEMPPPMRDAYDKAVDGMNKWQKADDAYKTDPTPENAAKREQAADESARAERAYQNQKIKNGSTFQDSNQYPHPADDPRVKNHEGPPDEPLPDTQPAPPTPPVPPVPGGAQGGFAQTLTGLGGLSGGLGSGG